MGFATEQAQDNVITNTKLCFSVDNSGNIRACFLETRKSSTSQPKACCPILHTSQLPPESSHELEARYISSASCSFAGAGGIRNFDLLITLELWDELFASFVVSISLLFYKELVLKEGYRFPR